MTDLDDLRARVAALENKVSGMYTIMQNMQRVYGELLQAKMGHGATVKEG